MKDDRFITPRVIIIDTNETLCFILRKILLERGYEVITCTDTNVCPVFHSKDHCKVPVGRCSDVIISDIHIPTVEGLKLIKERINKGCGVKFRALMSTNWTTANWEFAQSIGCRLFPKPFDLPEMLNWLDDCATQIDGRRQLYRWLDPNKKRGECVHSPYNCVF